MAKKPQYKEHKALRPYILIASIGLLVILLGAALWVISGQTPNRSAHTFAPASHSTATSGTQINTPVSPLLFGTNLGLFNNNDQVLTSSTARSLLQQMHMHIIRMPLRSSLSEATEIAAAQTIKSLGAIPLVVLHGS